MTYSIPMEDALKGTTLSKNMKRNLRLVAEIKAFGEDFLGLEKTHNYETVYIESSTPIYLVSASPKDRLELKTWCFPIIGKMPYLGFYRLKAARDEKERLLKDDFDVIIGKAEAYSTLGWFRDPVTLNMIEGSVRDLAEIIFHEMTHATLYVKGQASFNEGLASVVGKFGALQFMEKTYGASHPFTSEAAHLISDERLFAGFLSRLLARLEDLYDSPRAFAEKMILRKKIFDSSAKEFKKLMPLFLTARYRDFGLREFNNAYLMTIGLYHRNYWLFESVLRKEGSIKEMLQYLKGLEKEGGDMLSKMMKSFSTDLLQGCLTLSTLPPSPEQGE